MTNFRNGSADGELASSGAADLALAGFDDQTSPIIETLLVETGEALAQGSPLPTVDDLHLSTEELVEFQELQDTLVLLDQARRDGWLGRAATLAEKGAWPDAGHEGNAPDDGQRIGRFEIVRELGRGGHGVVFLARDPRLRRLVALKVARPESFVCDDLRHRFQREAEAAGSLHHPNLVEVFEAGEDGPICFIVSAYCSGPTLQHWLVAAGVQPTCREAAALTAALADGVAHAHAHGIFHRDVKPSNVLLESAQLDPARSLPAASRPLTSLSSYTPKLADFGLAKLLEGGDDRTRTGAVLGTPAYMAPEQAGGRAELIGPATDVYGLGVLLYELLVGSPPFRGESDIQTARRVCEETPTDPRRLRSAIDADLEAICLRCLEKDPAARYPTAAALAEDLARYLGGKPTLARPVGRLQAAARWIKRRPLPTALLAVSLALVASLTIGGWWTSLRNEQALRREAALRSAAETHKRHAEASSVEARRLLYASDMRVAHQLYQNGNLRAARQLLLSHAPPPGGEDLREFAWHFLDRRTQPEMATLRAHAGGVRLAVMSGDGAYLLTAGHDGEAKLWNTADRQVLLTLPLSDVRVGAFSLDNGRFAVADGEAAYVYAVADLEHPQRLPHAAGEPTALAFSAPRVSPQEELLCLGGRSGRVALWRTSDGRPLLETSAGDQPITGVAFLPNDDLLIAAGKRITLSPTADRAASRTWLEADADIGCIAASRGAGQVAVGLADGRTLLRASGAPAPDVELRHPAAISAVAFHPHGRLLAVASVDGTTKVWDGSTAACRVEFVGHVDRVSAIAFCHNGARLMTASDDGTVKLCRTEDEYFTAVDWPNFAVNAIDFSSDSGLLVWTGYPTSGGVAGYTGIVELPTLAADFLNGAAGVFADLQFLSTPRLFLGVNAGGARAEISVTQSPVVPRGFPRPADQTGWMPKLTATSDGAISVWGSCYPLHVADAQNNVKLLGADETAEVIELRINPAHERELIVASDKTIAVWDLQARRCTSRWAMPAPTKGFDFIDRTTIAVGGADEVLRIVDVRTGNFVAELPSNDGAINSVAIHPNGRTAALGHASGQISLWDLLVRRQLLTLSGHGGKVTRLTFSPNGQFLASGSEPGQVFIWSAGAASGRTPSGAKAMINEGSTEALVTRVTPVVHAAHQSPRIPSSVPFDLANLREKFRRVHDYAKSIGYSAAFPTGIDRETDEGVSIGVVALKRGVCQWHEALGTEVASAISDAPGADGPLLHQRRAAAWGQGRGYALAFANFHQAMLVDRLIYGVAQFDASAFTADRIKVSPSSDPRTLSERLRVVNRAALERGFPGALPTFDDDESAGTIGAAFFLPAAAESLSVPAHLLKN
ncbi:WD40 repeat domain-containing serine/threonine protein kinase [Lacipirellula limnantheis]|uniref:Serine/threonine-protein kinase PknB n=1 Tax=Lacipirellula limnantheis TaxID=2528024 RepID=A0A517TY35_9BACT|nr:serine/threonine-protein kinase [Lacipirellula limnantheis]QDT73293.1 Serine/threonine-protein kinase PknB [Lacipirellula limnantheis]